MSVDLGHKVGPLPLGAWLAVVGGGLGISFYVRHRGAGAAAETAALDPGSAVVLPSGAVGGGGGATTGGTGSGATDPSLTLDPYAPAGPMQILTNEDWTRAATNTLLRNGADFGLLSSALNHYTSGAALTPAETAIIEQATRLLGAIPIAPPPPPASSPVALPPAPIPAPAPQPATNPVTVPALPAMPPTPAVVLPQPQLAGQANYVTAPGVPAPGTPGNVVVGRSGDGTAYLYGGSVDQAEQIVNQQAPPTGNGGTPASWGGRGGWDDPHYSFG